MVTGVKLDNGVVAERVSICGGGALAVDARILLTFDVKCAAKSSAEKLLEF